MLTPQQRHETLHNLAAAIDRAGLRTPLSLALEALRPLDVLGCQFALFVAPFTTGYRWHQYARVLADEASWQELRSLLSRQDC